MEKSLICNICNEFSFEYQNDHNVKVHKLACLRKQNLKITQASSKIKSSNVKNPVRAFFSKFVTKSTEVITGIFFENLSN